MNRRIIFIFVLVACAVAVGIIFCLTGQTEPVYQGRTLSEWLFYERPASTPLSTPNPQREAIRKIGTNALPFLLRWIQYEPPAWRKKSAAMTSKLRIVDRKAELAQAGWLGFQILGPEARAAIPELTRLMLRTDPGASEIARQATLAMGGIGYDALPSLLAVLTNQQAVIRGQAAASIGAMRKLGTNASLAVPVLAQCLQDRDSHLAATAANSLGRLAVDPGVAVPALTRGLQHSEAYVRSNSARALGRFGKEARSALPSLVKALNDTHLTVREDVTNALRQIAPEVLENDQPR